MAAVLRNSLAWESCLHSLSSLFSKVEVSQMYGGLSWESDDCICMFCMQDLID